MLRTTKSILAFLTVVALQGCAAALSPVQNGPGFPYVPEKLETSSIDVDRLRTSTSWSGSVPACAVSTDGGPASARPADRASNAQHFPLQVRLSRGDRINISLLNGDEFNGDYIIGPDGQISLPHMPRQLAAALTEDELVSRLERALDMYDLVKSGTARVSVRIVKYAAIQVSVAGAVFQPGFVTINESTHDKAIVPETTRVYGDITINRNLSAALREANGARPDADLRNIQIIRRGKTYRFDLSGAITGHRLIDPALEDGDQVVVPSTGCFQNALVRPSIITPRGIRIYVSKIHIGPDARYDEKIPFGLRLLQGAIIASCVGGNLATEGRRQIVLVSINPTNGKTEVVQRSVEQLVRDQERDEINPMLMPDDAIACYDSTIHEAVGVAGAFGSIASSITSVITAQRLLTSGSP
jgi:polysaccharide export outer membrane protein